jgi:thiamine pyrophosphate-dependent acetolactate synthase large subunit-like protein
MAVGAALALQGTGRIPVAVLGDGDFLMGSNAIWTAARYRIPLLIVVANNRSFFNDEIHQQNVAIRRGRPVENRWIGQHIRNPDPDLSALATSLGLVGLGPVSNKDELPKVLENALGLVRDGESVVVDVHIGTEGYPS